MGADLLIGWLEMPLGKEPAWKKAEAAVKAVCASKKRLVKIYERVEQISIEERPILLKEIRRRVRDALCVTRQAWNGERRACRDWTKIEGAYSTILVTGGSSWGDTVGGLDEIEWMWESGAAKAAGFVFRKRWAQ